MIDKMETLKGNKNYCICHIVNSVAQWNATDFIWGLFRFWCSCHCIRWETTFIIILKHQKFSQVVKQKRKLTECMVFHTRPSWGAINRNQDSAFNIMRRATENLWFYYQQGQEISPYKLSRPARGPKELPIQWLPGLFPLD